MSRATGRLKLEPRVAIETPFRRPCQAEPAVRTDEMRTTGTTQIDGARLHVFMGRAVSDVRVIHVRRQALSARGHGQRSSGLPQKASPKGVVG
jgi:hypothetical protein